MKNKIKCVIYILFDNHESSRTKCNKHVCCIQHFFIKRKTLLIPRLLETFPSQDYEEPQREINKSLRLILVYFIKLFFFFK